jgi:hypothetical protein
VLSRSHVGLSEVLHHPSDDLGRLAVPLQSLVDSGVAPESGLSSVSIRFFSEVPRLAWQAFCHLGCRWLELIPVCSAPCYPLCKA